jgi:hypothetical protein
MLINRFNAYSSIPKAAPAKGTTAGTVIRFGKDSPDNDFATIKQRITLEPDHYTQNNYVLAEVDVARFDQAFQDDGPYQYITPGGGGASIKGRYEKFQTHLATGDPIYASLVYLQAEGPKGRETLKACFTNGRHRYAVMRDMGMKKMPIAIHKDCLDLLKPYGLI